MSTRASVIIKDEDEFLCFYQHCDGYPSGLGKTLEQFCKGKLAERSKGDLDYLGAALICFCNSHIGEDKNYSLPDLVPTRGVHGDEEYQYIIDCNTLELSAGEHASVKDYQLITAKP